MHTIKRILLCLAAVEPETERGSKNPQPPSPPPCSAHPITVHDSLAPIGPPPNKAPTLARSDTPAAQRPIPQQLPSIAAPTSLVPLRCRARLRYAIAHFAYTGSKRAVDAPTPCSQTTNKKVTKKKTKTHAAPRMQPVAANYRVNCTLRILRRIEIGGGPGLWSWGPQIGAQPLGRWAVPNQHS
jgi:hypothetical protein